MSETSMTNEVLNRLQRAIAHNKANKDEYLSLNKKCRLYVGANAALKSIEKEKAALLILPALQRQEVKDMLLSVAEYKNCPVWQPNITSQWLAKHLGLPRVCIAFTFSIDGDSSDSITSIRYFIIKNILNLSSSEEEIKNENNKKQQKLSIT